MSAIKTHHHDTIEAATRGKERPILFSTDMVRAILAGRKTQTRRIIKPQPEQIATGWRYGKDFKNMALGAGTPGTDVLYPYECPYYDIATRRLWVRETWAKQLNGKFIYRSDHQDWELSDYTATGAWRPSIHMPRAAARLILYIIDIRVERLQDISEDAAKAEGVFFYGDDDPEQDDYKNYLHKTQYDDFGVRTAKQSFETLWESINGPQSWAANPWVWVITFATTSPLPIGEGPGVGLAETPPSAPPHTGPEPAAPAAAPPGQPPA